MHNLRYIFQKRLSYTHTHTKTKKKKKKKKKGKIVLSYPWKKTMAYSFSFQNAVWFMNHGGKEWFLFNLHLLNALLERKIVLWKLNQICFMIPKSCIPQSCFTLTIFFWPPHGKSFCVFLKIVLVQQVSTACLETQLRLLFWDISPRPCSSTKSS